MPPCFSFHCPDAFEKFLAAQVVAMLGFRLPFCKVRSTTVSAVAMPAWSVPGSQSTSLPSMRALRARMSWMVLLRTWPMCSTPVTFGGGMTMEYAGLGDFGVGDEATFVQPELIPLVLDGLRLVCFGNFRHVDTNFTNFHELKRQIIGQHA